MTSETGQQTIPIHKQLDNQQFGQLIEYSMRNIFWRNMHKMWWRN